MNKHVHATLVLALGLGVAGCGGGGDGGGGGTTPAPALVPLTAANYQAISDSSTNSVANSSAILEVADSFAATSSASDPVTAAPVRSAALPISGRPDHLTRLAFSRLTAGSAGRVKAAALDAVTEPCVFGGSLRIDEDDADNNQAPSAGDRVTVTANNCVAAAGEAAINGTVTVRIRSISLDGRNEPTSAVLEIGYTSFGSTALLFNGAAVASISADELVLDFNGLSGRDGETNWVYNYRLTANLKNNTVSAVGPITVNGSTYQLTTPVVVRFDAAQPVEGTLRVSDGHGNRVDVQMGRTSYTASLYLTGDEVVDASATRRW